MPMTTAQQTDAYRFFAIAFSAAPGVEYMNQIASAYDSGATTKQIVNEFTKKSVFTSAYPLFLTNEQFASRLIDNVVGTSATDAAKTEAKADVVAALAKGSSRGDVIFQVFSNLAGLTGDAKWGNVALKMANQVATSQYYTETLGRTSTDITTLQAVLAGVDHTTTVTTAALDARLNPPPAGQTFTLTTGVDAVTGTAGNDTINSNVASFGALDVIAGGAGTDTLNVVDAATAFTGFGGATISGIETININTGGAVGAIQSQAGTDTTAAAQVVTRTFAAMTGANTFAVTIGSSTYTTGSVADKDAAATAVATILSNRLADSVTVNDSGAGVITLTSKVAGTPLPTVSITPVTTGLGGAVTPATTTANKVATAPTAVAQTQYVTFSVAPSVNETFTLSVGGADYAGTYSGASPTVTTAAADLAAAINAVLGAGSATSSAGVVTIVAKTAGTPLPAMNLRSSNTAVDAFTQGIANVAANASAVSAATVAAPAGTTAFNVTAAGDANVTGVTGAAVTVSATGSVRISGGSSATVTSAGQSTYVSGVTGPVTISESLYTTFGVGGFYVAASTTTGINGGWGTVSGATTTYQEGNLVTGGTTVTINGRGGLASSTGGVSYYDDTNNQVGSAANVGVSSANTATGRETILNASLAPTGDVSVSQATAFTRVDSTNALTTTGVMYGRGATKVYMNGGTTASVTGANSITIVDLGTTALKADTNTAAAVGTSKLTTVNIAGLTGTSPTAQITSDAVTAVKVIDSISSTTGPVVTVTNNTAGHGLALTVGNSGTSTLRLTVADSKATSVSIASQASSYGAIGTTLSNTGSASFLTLNTPLATAITMTNGQTVDLGDLGGSGYAKVATIDGSTATGSIRATLDATPTQGMSITTGSGADIITVGNGDSLTANATTAKTTNVSMGAGNDRLLDGGGSHAAWVGATFNGGDGTDLVDVTLINAGNSTQFVGFETLGLNIASAGAFDTTLMSGITGLELRANSTGTVTYAGVTTSQPLTVGATMANTGDAAVTALGFGTSVLTGSTDSYTVTFAATGATSAAATPTSIASGVISLTGIETVNVVSSSSSGFTANSVKLTDADARSLVISGSQNLTVAFVTAFGTASSSSSDGLGVASINASGLTGKLTINTANVNPSNGGVIAITGGSGNDTITLSAGLTAATVNGGAGDDTITTSSVASTLTGGAGADTFAPALAQAGSTTAPVITTITDWTAGDKLSFTTLTALTKTQTEIAAATSLVSAINLALGAVAAGTAAWFTYGGNTYVVVEAGVDGLTTDDVVVKLNGVIDLTNSTVASNTLTGV